MKTAFIIRFHYEPSDPRFAWRMAYFKNKVFPRIISQGDDFEIAIRCHCSHAPLFKALSDRVRTFQVVGECAKYKTVRGKKYFFDFVSFGECRGLDRYELQIGLDSDDLIEPGYYEEIKKLLRPAIEKGESAHLCFQPGLIDAKSGEKFPMPNRYSTKKGSAFFAIYQPASADPFVFAYQESHLTIGRHFINRLISPRADLCFASCHELNESTRL